MQGFIPHAPSLYLQSEGEDLSTKVALSLTRAPVHHIVRLTGGCGDMSAEDARGLYDFFAGAFTGFRGAMLFGGTQMLQRDDPKKIVPGITEVAPLIRKENPESIVLGIVPRTNDLKLSSYGMVVSEESEKNYFTIVHPDQDMCVVIQHSVDTGVSWDAEYLFAEKVVENLVHFCGWKQLLIAYNGGGVTEREIRLWAKHDWPVLLIEGSGRTCDALAKDPAFLRKHPSVVVVPKNATLVRTKLLELGILTAAPPKLARVV